MSNRSRMTGFAPRPLAAAFALALTPAWGQSTEPSERFIMLTTPESVVRAGVGYLDGDGVRFGQYTGINESGAYGLLDVSLVRRDSDTGIWLTLFGRNLGLDSREATLEYRRQGFYRFYAAYDQTPRYSQYVVNTALAGVGGDTLDVRTSGKRDLVPETMRRKGTVGLAWNFRNGLQAEFRASSETKEGTRIFGRGNFSGGANFNYLAEPVDRTTHSLDATVDWVGERLQLQAGYKGQVFSTETPALTVTGGGAAFNGAGTGTFSPMALPPGNESHHFYASGAWNLGPGSTTRGNFKAAYTRAAQDERFIGNPPGVTDSATTGNISGRTDLGGRLDTTLLQAGISSRPLPQLDLNGTLRYEDRDDRTPLAQYLTASGAVTTDGYNEPRSIRFTSAKGTAGYRLGGGYKIVGTVDFERKERNTSPVRVVAHRDEVDETTFRLDLRRYFSDTVNGAVAVAHSRRGGSDFEFTTRLNGSPYSNLIAPVFEADRSRDRVRFEADWQATEALNIQVAGDGSRDRYDTRYDLGLGVRRGDARFLAIDASYALHRNWRLTAWASRSVNGMEQSTSPNAAVGQSNPAAGIVSTIWSADLDLRSDSYGLGLRGQVQPDTKVGADLQVLRDRSAYDLGAVTGTAPVGPLPRITHDVTTLRLWAVHEVSANFGLRVDYQYDRRKIDDWTWAGFTYLPAADGTTLRTNPDPRASFIGLSGYWKWR